MTASRSAARARGACRGRRRRRRAMKERGSSQQQPRSCRRSSPHRRAGRRLNRRRRATRPPAELIASFDGLGSGSKVRRAPRRCGNPSDNTLAVGPESHHPRSSTRGWRSSRRRASSSRQRKSAVRPGPPPTRVQGLRRAVRSPQQRRRRRPLRPARGSLADRHADLPARSGAAGSAAGPDGRRRGVSSRPGMPGQPGAAVRFSAAASVHRRRPRTPGQRGRGLNRKHPATAGTVLDVLRDEHGSDPFGRTIATSFCAAVSRLSASGGVARWLLRAHQHRRRRDREARLRRRAREDAEGRSRRPSSASIIDGVNFLNNADLDGKTLPPAGAPNVMMAAGGTQLKKVFEDDGILRLEVPRGLEESVEHERRRVPTKIAVAPYHYLVGGQLTNCVPQPGTERRLDAQGDKMMARLVYRRVGDRE